MFSTGISPERKNGMNNILGLVSEALIKHRGAYGTRLRLRLFSLWLGAWARRGRRWARDRWSLGAGCASVGPGPPSPPLHGSAVKRPGDRRSPQGGALIASSWPLDRRWVAGPLVQAAAGPTWPRLLFGRDNRRNFTPHGRGGNGSRTMTEKAAHIDRISKHFGRNQRSGDIAAV